MNKKFRNEYKIVDDVVIIYIKRRTGEILETLIDLEDFPRIKELDYSWYVQWDKKLKSYYARTSVLLGRENGIGKRKSLLLHSFIMDAQKGQYVDHKNHNTLDNRKENLSLGTPQANSVNRKSKNSNNNSGYRNVCWFDKKWVVQISVNGKNLVCGKFDDVDEAGAWAEVMRQKYYMDYGNDKVN